jgi:hypothetical protein
VGSHWRTSEGEVAARHGAGVGRWLARRRRRPTRVSGLGRMGETSGIKSGRGRCRSPQGGVNPYHAGASGGRDRPGKSGGAARPWRARGRVRETREGREYWGSMTGRVRSKKKTTRLGQAWLTWPLGQTNRPFGLYFSFLIFS